MTDKKVWFITGAGRGSGTRQLYIHKGDPYGTYRFSHRPAGRQ
jgi:hypothetical protein